MEFCDAEDEKPRTGKRKRVVTLPYRLTIGKRDSGIRKKTPMYLHLKFLRQKGGDYVKAWYLYKVLNYIKRAPILNNMEEILERIENEMESCHELEIVKNFVMKNSEEILKDCRGE